MKSLQRFVWILILAAMLLSGCGKEQSELYDRGMELLSDGDYLTSAAMFQGAVKAGERLCESYRGLGISLLESGDYAGSGLIRHPDILQQLRVCGHLGSQDAQGQLP